MLENRNTILAVILSGLVLIAWQYFYNIPQMEKQRAAQQAQAELQKKAAATQPDNNAATSTPPQASTSTPAPTAVPAAARDPAIPGRWAELPAQSVAPSVPAHRWRPEQSDKDVAFPRGWRACRSDRRCPPPAFPRAAR